MKFYGNVICRSLSNGMEIFLLPLAGSAVEVQCVVRTGSIHEGEFLGFGLSHFLEHMLFQGCAGYPGTAAADSLDELGAKINAYTSNDHTNYHVRVEARHLEKAIDVIGAMVRAPEFPEARFRQERDVILRERDLSDDNPDRRLFENAMRQLYSVHPNRHPVIGYRPLIEQVDRARMAQYYRSRYTPERIFWVLTGAFDPAQALKIIQEKMESMPRASLAEPVLPTEPEQLMKREFDSEYPDPLSRLMVCFRIPGITSREMPALDLLSGVLAMGDGSVLVRELERKKELAANIRSFCFAVPGGGLVAIAAECPERKLAGLENALYRELEKVRNGGLECAAVEREKSQQFSTHLNMLRDPGAIAANIVGGVIAASAPALSDRYLELMKQVRLEDVLSAAKKYLDETRFTVIRQHAVGQMRKHLPKIAASTRTHQTKLLANGSRAVALPDRTLPLADFAMVLPCGSIFERPEEAGLSQMVSELLLAGTKKHGEESILREFDRLGATVNVNAGANSMMVELSAPRRKFESALGLLLEILHDAQFPASAFEREKQNLLLEMESAAQQPHHAAVRLLRKEWFGSHPYSWGPSGTMEQIALATREKVEEFYHRSFCPGQLVFGFGGDLPEERMFSLSETFAAALGRPELPERTMALPSICPGENHEFRKELPREQTAVVLGVGAPRLTGLEHLYCDLLKQCENHLSSRLFKRIREDNALAYTTGMTLAGGFHPGLFQFYAVTSVGQMDRAVALLREEIARIGTEGIAEKEFNSAKESATFQAAQLLDSVGNLLPAAVLDVHYHSTVVNCFNAGERIRGISYLDWRTFLEKYFNNPVIYEIRTGKLK